MKNIIPPNFKSKAVAYLPYLFIYYAGNKFAEAYRLALGDDFFSKTIGGLSSFTELMETPFLSFNTQDMLAGVVFAVFVYVTVHLKKKNAKNYRKNGEYGSGRWGTPKDIQPFVDPNPDNNIILTQTEGLTMNPRPKPVKYARNKNVLVIGGSGSGKTRFFIKPNLMQCESPDYKVSFVCTDPKGDLIISTGKMLQKFGYKIKVLNTINFAKSMQGKCLYGFI